MSITVVQFPQAIVNENPVTNSRWSAVHHPIYFRMNRTDCLVAVHNNGLGKCRLVGVSGLPFPVSLVVGQYVYLNAGPYIGRFLVTAVHNTPTYYFDIDKNFTGGVFAGPVNFLDAYVNYYVETIVYGVSPSNAYYELGTMVNKPDGAGVVRVDVSGFAKSMVSFQNTFDYVTRNKRDETSGGRFNIQFREVYNGIAQPWSGVSGTNLFYMVNSSKQVQQIYGSNMGEYVPFISADTQKAKFLSDFVRPTYFPGFPFSLDFIFSEQLFGKEVNKFEQRKDLNGTTLATNDYELDNSQVLYVNRMKLEEGYASNVKFIDVWLESGSASCLQYVEEDYVADDYVEEVCTLPPVETGSSSEVR